ncbi:alpha/beta hydrolase [Ktedonosporobacter rubrisoli]|uniref:Alpha/beta hydrolase n=1 Tax=Ktedonosporobacter rubrisoli TaxID=2509675 RepID=A0A4P6JLX6_KTERU|nr:alpha/beta hydrolase [Ktedonosporobacter rubrisoli]QBD76093.1 alpha/beta hydrolase [Ktedonosporobacter rubrisoli]
MERQGKINIGGFELSYRCEGQGTPVLIIGSTIYYPRLFSAALREKLQLIFIDHRGFATAPAAYKPEDYTLERILDDTEAIRELLGLDKFVMLGHSGHAFLALEYAKKYPAHVQKVALFNSAPTNNQERQKQSIAYFLSAAEPERKKKFEQDIALLQEDIKRDPARRFVHMLIRMGPQSFYDYHIDAAPMWEGVTTNMPIIDYLWGKAFAQLDLRKSLASFDKSVLLGLGQHDYLVGPVDLWAGIENEAKQVKKVIFARSGHNPMYEEPELFDRTLFEWIEGRAL